MKNMAFSISLTAQFSNNEIAALRIYPLIKILFLKLNNLYFFLRKSVVATTRNSSNSTEHEQRLTLAEKTFRLNSFIVLQIRYTKKCKLCYGLN